MKQTRRNLLRATAGIGVGTLLATGPAQATSTEAGEILWEFRADEPQMVDSSPTVVDGVVYTGGGDRALHALDAATGEPLWRYDEPPGLIDTAPTVVDGAVFFTAGRDVYAVDAATGEELWSQGLNTFINGSLTVYDSRLFVAVDDDTVPFYALDPVTGEELWTFEAGGQFSGPPVATEGTVYVGSGAGIMYAIDAETGDEIWAEDVDSDRFRAGTVYDGLVIAGNESGVLYAFDASTGTVEWEREIGSWIRTTPTARDDVVYIDGGTSIFALNAETGSEIWEFPTMGGGQIQSSLTVAGDLLVYGGWSDNQIYGIDTDTGTERWTVETDSQISSSPTVVDGVAYTGRDDHLAAIQTDVEESSDGTRVMLAVKGHHDGWQYADQDLGFPHDDDGTDDDTNGADDEETHADDDETTDDQDYSGEDETTDEEEADDVDEAGIDDADEDTDDDADDADDDGPGLGIPTAIAGIGTAGYLLKSRLGEADDPAE